METENIRIGVTATDPVDATGLLRCEFYSVRNDKLFVFRKFLVVSNQRSQHLVAQTV